MTYSFDFLIFGDGSVVDECVIVKEESAGDIESYEDINAVMLVSGQDEEDSKAIAEPSECVEEEDPPAGVFSDEEVEESQRDSVAREHVVPTGSDPCSGKTGQLFSLSSPPPQPELTLQRQSCSRPNNEGFVQSAGPTSIWAWPGNI